MCGEEHVEYGEDYVECNICATQLKYCGSLTTNMGKHIKTKHEHQYNKLKHTGFLKENTKITYVSKTAQ